jgi:hypothetical protein
MFSRMMMASSTSMPETITKPTREIALMVRSNAGKRISAIRKEKGTPTMASMALRKPTVNQSTKTTNTTPSTRLLRMMRMRAST